MVLCIFQLPEKARACLCIVTKYLNAALIELRAVNKVSGAYTLLEVDGVLNQVLDLERKIIEMKRTGESTVMNHLVQLPPETADQHNKAQFHHEMRVLKVRQLQCQVHKSVFNNL